MLRATDSFGRDWKAEESFKYIYQDDVLWSENTSWWKEYFEEYVWNDLMDGYGEPSISSKNPRLLHEIVLGLYHASFKSNVLCS